MRLAVFLPNWIGDVVMATPALRALRRVAGEKGQLIGVMRPYVAEVLAGTPWLDEEILYSPDAKKGDLRQSAALARLRAARPDRIVLFTNSLRTGWMAYRAGARERVGTARSLRRWLMTTKVDTGGAAIMAELVNLISTNNDEDDQTVHSLALTGRFTSSTLQPSLSLVVPFGNDAWDNVIDFVYQNLGTLSRTYSAGIENDDGKLVIEVMFSAEQKRF